MASFSASTPIVPIATSRTRSPAIISHRRSIRSESAPDASTTTTCGVVHATPTAANAAGDAPSSWYTSQATATM